METSVLVDNYEHFFIIERMYEFEFPLESMGIGMSNAMPKIAVLHSSKKRKENSNLQKLKTEN